MNDIPYLLRSVRPLATESSTLISSSKYLNHPRLRQWVGEIALKRNGPDMLPQAEMHELVGIIHGLQDNDYLDSLFTEERKRNPALDAWFEEAFVSTFTTNDFKDYPEGSLGWHFYRDVICENYELVIYQMAAPTNQFEFFQHRAGQMHDLEHILTGGGFNYMGELVPGWARITTLFKNFHDKELASECCLLNFCSTLRYTIRTMFNYPTVWPVCQDAIERGMRVGHESDAFFLRHYEDAFHMPLAEAREFLGIRGVRDVDTAEPSKVWSERA